jgi:YD repeat-containing protein
MCPRCGGIKELTGPLSWNLKWTRDGDFDVTAFRDARGNTTRYEYNLDKELTAVTHADGTGEQYLYERWGRLGTLVNGRGQREVNSYGLSADVTAVTFPDTAEPGIYRVIQSNSGSGTPGRVLRSVNVANQMDTAITYTPTGKVASVEYLLGGGTPFWGRTQRVEYTYFADDLVKTITWKDGGSTGPIVGSWTYTYNGVGAVTKVVNNFGETTVYTYDSHGRISVQDNQTSRTRVKYTYATKRDWRTRIVAESFTSTGVVTPLYDFQLTYNAAGNVTKITELGGRVRDFN